MTTIDNTIESTAADVSTEDTKPRFRLSSKAVYRLAFGATAVALGALAVHAVANAEPIEFND